MGTTTLDNGVRKTLASQLDRLDTILDGLAENLNEAVAIAATSSIKEIVNVAVDAFPPNALEQVGKGLPLESVVTFPMAAGELHVGI